MALCKFNNVISISCDIAPVMDVRFPIPTITSTHSDNNDSLVRKGKHLFIVTLKKIISENQHIKAYINAQPVRSKAD